VENKATRKKIFQSYRRIFFVTASAATKSLCLSLKYGFFFLSLWNQFVAPESERPFRKRNKEKEKPKIFSSSSSSSLPQYSHSKFMDNRCNSGSRQLLSVAKNLPSLFQPFDRSVPGFPFLRFGLHK